MSDNPYSAILDLTKSEQPQDNVMIGEVISADPLVIQIGELQIDRDNLLIADYLLVGYSRSYHTDRVIPDGSSSGKVQYVDGLDVGDKLAVLQTADKQVYIIIARVKEV